MNTKQELPLSILEEEIDPDQPVPYRLTLPAQMFLMRRRLQDELDNKLAARASLELTGGEFEETDQHPG